MLNEEAAISQQHGRVDHVTNRCQVMRDGHTKTHLETEDEPSVLTSDNSV